MSDGPKLVAHLLCDFCGKHHDYVEALIAGPKHNHICNECVGFCVEILNERRKRLTEACESATGGSKAEGK